MNNELVKFLRFIKYCLIAIIVILGLFVGVYFISAVTGS